MVAERQGQTAARNMLGQREPFHAVPFFWSQHYDVPINYVGHAEKWDEITWVVAERQGQTAARNMLGQREVFDAVPFFWSQHYDVPINYVGHAEKWDEIAVDGNIAGRDCVLRYKSGGRVLAVASIYRDLASLQAEVAMERAALSGEKCLSLVMPGLVPGIHVLKIGRKQEVMAGTSPAMTKHRDERPYAHRSQDLRRALPQFPLGYP